MTAVEKTANYAITDNASIAQQELLRNKLQQILNNENELKHLLQLRMDELKDLIGQSTRQSAVNSTYGQFHDRALLLGKPQIR
ncbi:Flagellar protein FliT [compost metagenome]